ncbi:hypothetical protein KDK95_11645, partial [Actinospica sp. MGRD01-02]
GVAVLVVAAVGLVDGAAASAASTTVAGKAAAGVTLPGEHSGAAASPGRGAGNQTSSSATGSAPGVQNSANSSSNQIAQGNPVAAASSAAAASTAGATAAAGAHAAGSGATAAGRTYDAVAGLGCSGSSTATYSDSEGYYTNGNAGWLRPSDGFAGEGCTGVYDAVPMSGTAGLANYDKTGFALYKWNITGTFTTATCAFSVYVPNDSSIMHVGGNPTYYYFWNQDYSFGENMTPSGDFSVPEISDRGKWVTESSFTTTTGYVTLKLVNSGVDYTSSGAADYAHHAASAVRLTCS